jgi:hypothetical protein
MVAIIKTKNSVTPSSNSNGTKEGTKDESNGGICINEFNYETHICSQINARSSSRNRFVHNVRHFYNFHCVHHVSLLVP